MKDEIHYFMDIIICDPSIYTMDPSDFSSFSYMEYSIGLKRVNSPLSFSDVTVGAILGIVIAYIVYRQYYPSVNKLNAHLPYISLEPINTQLMAHDRQLSPVGSPSVAVNVGHMLDIKDM